AERIRGVAGRVLARTSLASAVVVSENRNAAAAACSDDRIPTSASRDGAVSPGHSAAARARRIDGRSYGSGEGMIVRAASSQARPSARSAGSTYARAGTEGEAAA